MERGNIRQTEKVNKNRHTYKRRRVLTRLHIHQLYNHAFSLIFQSRQGDNSERMATANLL